MKTATLIQGKVKYQAGPPRLTRDGRERINVVVSPSSGAEDLKIWGNPGDPIAYLTKGDAVTLAYDGNSYTLISDQATPAPEPEPPPAQAPTQAPAPRNPQSSDVKEWVAIFEELRAALPHATEQTWRGAASTLFIQRCKLYEDSEEF